MEHLKDLPIRLEKAGLTVKPSKCQFAMSEYRYLGHIIGKGKVRPEKDKLRGHSVIPSSSHKEGGAIIFKTGGILQAFHSKFCHNCGILDKLDQETRARTGIMDF